MRAYERLLKYVSVYTTSDPDSATVPSSMRQYDLANILVDELKALGLENVHVDENGVVYGWLSATAGCEQKPALGFIAHLDTAPDCSGENVKPQIIEHYDGGDVLLAGSGETLSPAAFPGLKKLVGMTLITTDGTTLLGADDKAGIAAIMTAAERIINEKRPHGRVAVCFTPDEEIGHGAALLDLERLGADFAYTVDGEELSEINYETFNAASAKWEVNGFNIHPGSAKNMMINASLVAMEINSMLPSGDTPAHTEGYEGFFHLTDMSGTVEKAMLSYIIRDHIAASFDQRIKTMEHIEKLINEKYGEGTAKLTVRQQYRNMRELIGEHMEIVELAERALRREGIEPVTAPVRGGTDGSQLTFRGLLCPNIGTGGYSCHGPYEHITAEHLETSANIVLNIIDENLK